MDEHEKQDREAQREFYRDVMMYVFVVIIIALIIIF